MKLGDMYLSPLPERGPDTWRDLVFEMLENVTNGGPITHEHIREYQSRIKALDESDAALHAPADPVEAGALRKWFAEGEDVDLANACPLGSIRLVINGKVFEAKITSVKVEQSDET